MNFIQPILDFSFYLYFGITLGDSDYEFYYKIFAICACSFYLFIFFPQKFNLITGFSQVITYGMGAIAGVSFFLSIMISFENTTFAYAYWTTFVISAGIGSFLVKTKYKKE